MDSYLLLAKSQKGAAAAKIISDAAAANGTYVFSELLALPNIAQLKDDSTNGKSHALLELFAYGTLADLKQSPDAYPPLSPAQLTKLKQLTLVSLAHSARSLAYSDLLAALDIASVRELEDLVIDVIYADLLKGKLHHQEQVFHVEWVAGRDVKYDALPSLRDKLLNLTAATLLDALDKEIVGARSNSQSEKDQKLAYTLHRNNAYNAILNEKSKGRGGDNPFGQQTGEPGDMDFMSRRRVLGARSSSVRDEGRTVKKQK